MIFVIYYTLLFIDDVPSLDVMERSVTSQMGKKDLAGLTNFARSVRPESWYYFVNIL